MKKHDQETRAVDTQYDPPAARPLATASANEPVPTLITAHVCGGRQAKRCRDGGEHDMSAIVRFADGGSVACAKCGVTAMEIDMLELP